MRKLRWIGGTSFVLRLRGVSVKRLRSWVGLRIGTISRFLSPDIQQVAARENWADMANFNMQLHGDLVSLMKECTEGFEIVTEVGTRCMDTTESQVRSSQPIETHTVAGEVARTVASWPFRRGCKHGETRARAASGSR